MVRLAGSANPTDASFGRGLMPLLQGACRRVLPLGAPQTCQVVGGMVRLAGSANPTDASFGRGLMPLLQGACRRVLPSGALQTGQVVWLNGSPRRLGKPYGCFVWSWFDVAPAGGLS